MGCALAVAPACAPAVSPVELRVMEPIAYTIKDAVKVAGIGRTKLYEAIGKGELRTRKAGRRTLIVANELREWIDKLPLATR